MLSGIYIENKYSFLDTLSLYTDIGETFQFLI